MDADVIVIGGGTAGLTAALAARVEGASVTLIEAGPRIGGDCTFRGCVPSKALIETARLAHELARASEDGIISEAPPLDFAAVMARKARIVEQIAADESDERFTRAGIEVVHGRARFVDEHTVEAAGRTLRGTRFVIATGSRPRIPPISGLDTVPHLTNEDVFELERLPSRLAVLGGGPTGLELAQAFQRLGSAVTVLENEQKLLRHDEPEAGELVATVLRGEGVDLRLQARVVRVERPAAETILHLDGGATLACDALLVAAGRRGALEELGIELALEDGYVKVDDRCRTSRPHVYAAGDVSGGLQFTHVAAHEGQVAGRNAAGRRARKRERVVPRVTFLDPEVAHVGLTEAQARERHRRVQVLAFPLSDADRARILERPVGFVKLVSAARPLLGRLGGGVLVGAQVVGPRAGELIDECALAMQTRCFAGRLAQTIHAYPTASLALQQTEAQLTPVGRALAPAPGPEA
ncbi:MAG: dihydrolipoyl dehydrogenase family protein [Gaiellaceae bacterium]